MIPFPDSSSATNALGLVLATYRWNAEINEIATTPFTTRAAAQCRSAHQGNVSPAKCVPTIKSARDRDFFIINFN